MLRVFRILRILRLLKSAKGLRNMLVTLILSFPSLVNVAALLGLPSGGAYDVDVYRGPTAL